MSPTAGADRGPRLRAGRRSEWLLLLFAPALFVALTPLLTAKFVGLVSSGSAPEASLVPPLFVGVPALFIFTLVAGGLRRPGWRILSHGSTSSWPRFRQS
jgi:hypothetical protein